MKANRYAWAWVPTLYFAEGIPYAVVMFLSVVLYKRLGLSNTDVALYTSWLYLPWVIKPLWSPFVDLVGSKRRWIVAMQLLVGAGLAGVAFCLPMSHALQLTLCCFYLLAFSSATHDIAADGFYMLALDSHSQALFVGIRSTFYRISMLVGQGLLVALAGSLETLTHRVAYAWSLTFYLAAALFIGLALWHSAVLPRPAEDSRPPLDARHLLRGVADTFASFFRKPGAPTALLFMLLYRMPEALLVKVCPLFLLDPVKAGGLGLSTGQVGFANGTVGVVGLTVGGILGGIAASVGGLKRWLWPMVAAITIPDLVYVFLAYTQPANFIVVNVCICFEQFGYGFGFTAYMLFLIYYARGAQKTAHYAIATAFMALSMMLPGMVAGWLQEAVGYGPFFIIVMLCCLVTIGVSALVKIDPDFGRKHPATQAEGQRNS